MAKAPAPVLDPTSFEGPETDHEATIVSPNAPVTIRGRNVEVPEHFANRIKMKIARLERLDPEVSSFDVQLSHENNPRLSRRRQRIELTARGRSYVARAEAGEENFYAALESAVSKLDHHLRKARTKRKINHTGHRRPMSVAEATANWEAVAEDLHKQAAAEASAPAGIDVSKYNSIPDSLPGQVVRQKTHKATPMTVDEALEKMELVGHDFYLFSDLESGKPTVVYRRHAFDYGTITLDESA